MYCRCGHCKSLAPVSFLVAHENIQGFLLLLLVIVEGVSLLKGYFGSIIYLICNTHFNQMHIFVHLPSQWFTIC